jgi:hypothetical protein
MSSANAATVVLPFVRPAWFGELNFSGGYVRMWTGVGDIVTLGRTFAGGGELIGIAPIEEAEGVTARNLSLSLSGVPSTLIATVLGENYRLRSVKLWRGFMNAGFTALLADPDLRWAGRMNTCRIERTGTTASIEVNCESRLADLRRAATRRYSHEEQQARYPGDLFFEFASALAEAPIHFGTRSRAGEPGYS